jgi:membrane glycosyltransferase
VAVAVESPSSTWPHPEGDLPPPAPLSMVPQSLSSAPDRGRTSIGWRAATLLILTAAMTVLGILGLAEVLAIDTLGPLDFLVLAVFAPLFAWTAFSFASALSGLWATWRDRDRLDLEGPAARLVSRTAILMPVYNEAPDDLVARIQAMWRSLEHHGETDAFDFFVLSDSTDRPKRDAERESLEIVRRRLPEKARIYYRHRAHNIDRKAGNIADWVRRFGGAYAFMVILDADSLMEGETLARLAGAMERNPRLGLLQTVPVVINRHSLFARVEQFASRLYGPILARGLGWWSGDQGNYWGHNAIIRVAAFAEAAGLPHLPGRKPFGGHILSHDFVEAALIRRAGWEVRLAPEIGGSFEESPPTLADTIVRDRRWCQGNLQHLKVLGACGLAPVSRLHLGRGILSYLVAPLWLILMVASVLLALKPEWGVGDAQIADLQLLGPAHSHPLILGVFALSMIFLLAPKLIAFFAMMASPGQRKWFGGGRMALASMALEILFSAMAAPVLLLNQVWTLVAILFGRDSGWGAQRREEDQFTLDEAADRHFGDTAVGAALAISALAVSMQVFLWMLPVILGMALSIPIAALSARRDLGEAARRAGLLLTPEEIDPSPVVRAYNAARGQSLSWAPHAQGAPAQQPALALVSALEA